MTDDDDDVHLANPAGRLFLVLQELQQQGTRSTTQKPISVAHVLRSYVGIEADDTVGFYNTVAALFALPVQIREAVAALDDPTPPANVLVRPLGNVQKILPDFATGRGTAHQTKDKISAGTLAGLETCSYVLNKHSGAKPLASDTLAQIGALAEEIIDALVSDTTLSAEFREAIRVHAHRIQIAVDFYRIHGADAIIDEFDALTGVIYRNKTEADEHSAHPVFAKFKKLAGVVLIALQVYAGPAQIAESYEYYGELTAPPTVTEAPAEPPSDTA